MQEGLLVVHYLDSEVADGLLKCLGLTAVWEGAQQQASALAAAVELAQEQAHALAAAAEAAVDQQPVSGRHAATDLASVSGAAHLHAYAPVAARD